MSNGRGIRRVSTIEKAMDLSGGFQPKYGKGIVISSKLLDLSRKHDGVRYYIAECEAGKVSLIEAQTLIIEMLLNEQRGIK